MALSPIIDPLVLGIFAIIALGSVLLNPIGLILAAGVAAGVAIAGVPPIVAGTLFTLLNNAVLPFIFAT